MAYWTIEAHQAIRDGSRQSSKSQRYVESLRSVKRCLNCPHWVRLHPQHGACVGRTHTGDRNSAPCYCQEFVDPEPGRPDRVFTREQVDKLSAQRWKLVKDSIYLMVDGRYGILDPWTDVEKYFVCSS